MGEFEKTATEIASQVSLLHGLSNTIRKASRESQNVQAATSFQIKDEDGNDIEDYLRHYFLKGLCDRFPQSSDSIQNRLASTMIIRRKRILYRRGRYASKPAELPLPASKPVALPLPAPRRKQLDGSGIIEGKREEARSEMSPSVVRSAMQSATTLMPQDLQRASAPSVVSHTSTIDLGAHESLVFPPRPQLQSHSMVESTCPYCLFALPALDTSTQARWRWVRRFSMEVT